VVLCRRNEPAFAHEDLAVAGGDAGVMRDEEDDDAVGSMLEGAPKKLP
jgi:hypothetical protein